MKGKVCNDFSPPQPSCPYRDPSLLCRVSTVFVRGVLSRWTPQVLEALQRQASATPMAGGKKPDKSKSKGTLSLLAQFPGAEEELKEALQVRTVHVLVYS